jgi:hypothetical protein
LNSHGNFFVDCNTPDTIAAYIRHESRGGGSSRRLVTMLGKFKALAVVAGLAGACVLPAAAQAGWHGGFFIGLPPVVVAPAPYAYPYPAYPPAYYPPAYAPPPYGYYPPAAYTPAPALTPEQQKAEADREASVPYGRTCYAGFYTCAAPPNTHVGTGCACPGIGAPSYGTVN